MTTTTRQHETFRRVVAGIRRYTDSHPSDHTRSNFMLDECVWYPDRVTDVLTATFSNHLLTRNAVELRSPIPAGTRAAHFTVETDGKLRVYSVVDTRVSTRVNANTSAVGVTGRHYDYDERDVNALCAWVVYGGDFPDAIKAKPVQTQPQAPPSTQTTEADVVADGFLSNLSAAQKFEDSFKLTPEQNVAVASMTTAFRAKYRATAQRDIAVRLSWVFFRASAVLSVVCQPGAQRNGKLRVLCVSVLPDGRLRVEPIGSDSLFARLSAGDYAVEQYQEMLDWLEGLDKAATEPVMPSKSVATASPTSKTRTSDIDRAITVNSIVNRVRAKILATVESPQLVKLPWCRTEQQLTSATSFEPADYEISLANTTSAVADDATRAFSCRVSRSGAVTFKLVSRRAKTDNWGEKAVIHTLDDKSVSQLTEEDVQALCLWVVTGVFVESTPTTSEARSANLSPNSTPNRVFAGFIDRLTRHLNPSKILQVAKQAKRDLSLHSQLGDKSDKLAALVAQTLQISNVLPDTAQQPTPQPTPQHNLIQYRFDSTDDGASYSVATLYHACDDMARRLLVLRVDNKRRPDTGYHPSQGSLYHQSVSYYLIPTSYNQKTPAAVTTVWPVGFPIEVPNFADVERRILANLYGARRI